MELHSLSITSKETSRQGQELRAPLVNAKFRCSAIIIFDIIKVIVKIIYGAVMANISLWGLDDEVKQRLKEEFLSSISDF